MDRRRFLLTVGANKWLTYPFEFLYHSLIPTQINGSKVQDKAKLVKIYGNGVVENQLAILRTDITNNGNIRGTYDSATQTRSYSGTATSGAWCNLIQQGISWQNGKKYLAIVGKDLTNVSGASYYFAGKSFNTTSILSITTTNTENAYLVVNEGTVLDISGVSIQIIDLTLMFGTGNEPTTLTDNRIQALLNRGYIAYNTGSYKNSRVGEIACYVFPKELIGVSSLLGQQNVPYSYGSSQENVSFYPMTDGSFYYYGGSSTNRKTVNRQANHKYFLLTKVKNMVYTWSYIGIWDTNSSGYEGNRAVPTQSGDYLYCIISPTTTAANGVPTLQFGNTNYNTLICEKMVILDLTELGIDNLTAQQVFELLNDATINSLANGDTLNSPSSKITLNGLLELNGAINSHDTFEITNTDYVFTRNVGVVDLGDLSWSILNAGNFYCTRNLEWKKPTNDNIIGNIICHLYSNDTASHIQSSNNYTDKTIGLNVDPQIIVRDSAYSTAADFKNAMAGIYAYLELATPQVITIPKKHLGCVDLGSLSWTYDSGNARFLSSDVLSNAELPSTSSTLANVYCGLYKTGATGLGLNDLEIALHPNGLVYVKNTSYTSASTFKSAMAGVYLFYETDAEVSDFDNIAQINAGGSINANEFSANFEQVIANGDFADTSAWSFFSGDSDNNFTVSGNIASIKMYSYNGGNTIFRQQYTPVSGHKYLLVADYRVTTLTQSFSWVLGSNSIDLLFASTTYQRLVNIGTRTDANPTFGISLSVTRSIDFRLRNVKYIDLTETFGAGNEPTSENDYRVQYILNGGSLDAVAETEVLPNVNFKIKCK